MSGHVEHPCTTRSTPNTNLSKDPRQRLQGWSKRWMQTRKRYNLDLIPVN
ncbi:hypothetical protein NQ315_001726 [Exocentrus adspersus]|uniref:Uncharacterized protein n=1 Tax=Exocentrus adspersus TaxID=1586481 RepID=A0AAV8WA15_9CUCU|nr:hypothetical protein NQ315_001726 [Exocentrus adspersus]